MVGAEVTMEGVAGRLVVSEEITRLPKFQELQTLFINIQSLFTMYDNISECTIVPSSDKGATNSTSFSY